MDTAALFLAYRNLEDKKKPKGQNSSEEDFRPSKKKNGNAPQNAETEFELYSVANIRNDN